MFCMKNKIDKNELKVSLVESIKKNRCCIDYLEEVERKIADIYEYTNKDSDRIELEKVQWILFNMKYNTNMFEKTLKQNGGCLSGIRSFKWE